LDPGPVKYRAPVEKVCHSETDDVGAFGSDGSLAWKQKDGMMFYCNSGYKYCQGKRHEYTSSKPMAKTAHVGDRVGLLVDTWPASRMKPSGQTVTLYINSVSQVT
jgi:hypothetical protein